MVGEVCIRCGILRMLVWLYSETGKEKLIYIHNFQSLSFFWQVESFPFNNFLIIDKNIILFLIYFFLGSTVSQILCNFSIFSAWSDLMTLIKLSFSTFLLASWKCLEWLFSCITMRTACLFYVPHFIFMQIFKLLWHSIIFSMKQK